MAKPRSVCVYCGSSTGRDPAYLDTACRMGEALAGNGIDLVYGGGGLGLMGATADAALKAGGRVVGIIPEFLKDIEAQLEDVTELIITHSMHERKQIMFERSDAFVALPGGIGTLEELIEVMTWAQLARHAKPIIIVNTHNYWGPLMELFDHMVESGFVQAETARKWVAVPGVDQVLPAIEQRLSPETLKAPSTFEAVF